VRAPDWVEDSYLLAVLRRFFALELLDRSFGLAAQAFVALLPLIIVLVSLFTNDSSEIIANSVGDRFGLDSLAREALRALFTHSPGAAISWFAILLSLLSAFSLSRRLARIYASLFGVAPLPRSQNWRGLVWIVLQLSLFIAASSLRAVRRDGGVLLAVCLTLVLMVLWFAADFVSVRLLVPTARTRLIAASAIVSSVGRLGMAIWATVYMPRTLNTQAALYGPIGVTFAIFTYLLVAALVYVCAPLIVTTWVAWREGRTAASVPE
jgi:membrane protein